MKLFDDIKRKNMNPRQNSKSLFSYLNESARPTMQKIRSLLELWFSNYPEEEQLDLRNRFRSKKKDDPHLGAFFELCVHQLLLTLNYQLEIHPQSSKSTRPDFLVTDSIGSKFYLEATVLIDPYKNKYLDMSFDTVNELNLLDYLFHVDVIEQPRFGSRTSSPKIFFA